MDTFVVFIATALLWATQMRGQSPVANMPEANPGRPTVSTTQTIIIVKIKKEVGQAKQRQLTKWGL